MALYRGLLAKVCKAYSFTRCIHMLKGFPDSALDKTGLFRFWKLPIPEHKVQATYLWLEHGVDMRSKCRVLDFAPQSPEEVPEWYYDGSAVHPPHRNCSDCKLVPQAIYRDPFKSGQKDIIVLCETYNSDGTPTKFNKRQPLKAVVEQTAKHKCWFGYEQEYALMGCDGRPYGWPAGGFPGPQGPYYCGVGSDKAYVRDISEAVSLACLYAGVHTAGTNAEAMPSQWEYQVGPDPPMKLCDDLWVSRYILVRVAETYGIAISFDPKPVKGWSGSGGHMNFSTELMRGEDGLKHIEKAIEKLSKHHQRHLAVYDPEGGEDNKRRLTGIFETSSMTKFTWDFANRKVSVRVPRIVCAAGKGYLEDRRPAANCDPYEVCGAMLYTCLIENDDKDDKDDKNEDVCSICK